MRDFIVIIGLVGAVMIGVEGLLIILMYRRLEAVKGRFLTYPLIFIFILGIIYEIIYFIK
jgi:hypothetical protein